MATKRSAPVDPEYDKIPEPVCGKRRKLFYIEDRKNEWEKQIKTILQKQLYEEIQLKESDVHKYDDILDECRCRLDRVRACIIAKYYAASKAQHQFSIEKRSKRMKAIGNLSKQSVEDQNEEVMCNVHPAVQQCLNISGSLPNTAIKTEESLSNTGIANCLGSPIMQSQNNKELATNLPRPAVKEFLNKSPKSVSLSSTAVKLEESPNVTFTNCIISPIKENLESPCENVKRHPPRARTPVQIVFGNVSKYIPESQRMKNEQVSHTHIWKVYLREGKKNGICFPKLAEYVKKVSFLLHPSFRPNDVVEVSQPPFELTRRGYGDFPLRIRLYFLDPRNKPIDLIHHLKLDKTYTGITTLGPETHADLHLYNIKVPGFSKTCEMNMNIVKEKSILISHPNAEQSYAANTKSSTVSEQQTCGKTGTVFKSSNIDKCSDLPKYVKFISLNKKEVPFIESRETSQINHFATLSKHTRPNFIPQHRPSSSNMLCDESSQQMYKKKQMPKEIVVNSSVNANSEATTIMSTANGQLKNGVTAFMKCTDSQGRTLLVPQTSLICISSNNLGDTIKNACSQNQRFNHISPRPSPLPTKFTGAHSRGLPFVQRKQPTMKHSNLPLYILKPAVSQQNGISHKNQIFLIAANEENKLLEMPSSRGLGPCLTSANGYSTTDSLNVHKPSITAAEGGSLAKKKPRMHWEKALEEMSTINCTEFVHLLKKVLKAFLRVKQQNIGAVPFPFCSLEEEKHKNWSIGKRRAAEWMFSGILKNSSMKIILNKPNQFLTRNCVWSRKEIMFFCRKHGYIAEKPCATPSEKSEGDETVKEKERERGSLSEPNELISHLESENSQMYKKISPSSEEINICYNKEEKDNVRKIETFSSSMRGRLAGVPHSSPAAVYVKESAGQVCVNIQPIDLEPGIAVPVVEEMILSACKELSADIIRTALNAGYNRMGGQMCPEDIKVADVYSAITENQDLQFLTNKFLGVLNKRVKR